jgi:hypothetical protein
MPTCSSSLPGMVADNLQDGESETIPVSRGSTNERTENWRAEGYGNFNLNLLDTNSPTPCNGKFDTKTHADSHPVRLTQKTSIVFGTLLLRKDATGAPEELQPSPLRAGAALESQYRTRGLRKQQSAWIVPGQPSRPTRKRWQTEGSRARGTGASGQDGSATLKNESFVASQECAINPPTAPDDQSAQQDERGASFHMQGHIRATFTAQA